MLTNFEIMPVARKSKVHFFSIDRPARLQNATTLKQFIESIFNEERQRLHCINYLFCSDKTVLAINKRYLNHDFYTDVIAFDLSETNEPINAEVYISIDRVRANAKKLGVSIKSELHRVLFHAALHLVGYDDKRKKDIERMRKSENELLAAYFSE